MSKITKKQLQESHNKLLNQFASLVRELKVNNVIDDSVCPTFIKKTEPQLKQLDQSVFDGEPEQIKWAVVTNEGAVLKFELEPVVKDGLWHWTHSNGCRQHALIGQYDASNWQNSLIERDTAKELLEVDLSSELTGSDLCRAMLERGDKYIVCTVDYGVVVITGSNKDGSFFSTDCAYTSAIPINNQGEPMTASEVGL